MTASEPMTREELRTLAALDVFGLLDEYESNLYTRSFHHASASVQDEILELQEAIAQNPPLLMSEEPVAQLRDKVMDSIAHAMDKESRKFAPIASIGRHRANNSLNGEPGQRHVHMRGAQFWRAATFVLAGALVAVAYFFATTVQHAQLVTELVLDINTAEQAKELLGHDFEYFVSNPDCDQFALVPGENAGIAASGIVYVNKATNEAFLFTVGLPHDNEEYVLRVSTDSGMSEELKSFSPRAALLGLRLDRLSSTLLASAMHWEIVSRDGVVLLSSA